MGGGGKVPLQMTRSLNRATKKETSQSIFKEAVHFHSQAPEETTDAVIMWLDNKNKNKTSASNSKFLRPQSSSL